MPSDPPLFSVHMLANAKFTYIFWTCLRRPDDKTPPSAHGRRGRILTAALAAASGRDFDVLGAGALGPLPHFERHALVFLQRLVAFAADFRIVREKVFAAIIGRDEAVAFFGVEPFDDACCHERVLHLRVAIARGTPDDQGWDRQLGTSDGDRCDDRVA